MTGTVADEVHRTNRGDDSESKIVLAGYRCRDCTSEWIKVTLRAPDGKLASPDKTCPFCGSAAVAWVDGGDAD